jgi:hypothetical protein
MALESQERQTARRNMLVSASQFSSSWDSCQVRDSYLGYLKDDSPWPRQGRSESVRHHGPRICLSGHRLVSVLLVSVAKCLRSGGLHQSRWNFIPAFLYSLCEKKFFLTSRRGAGIRRFCGSAAALVTLPISLAILNYVSISLCPFQPGSCGPATCPAGACAPLGLCAQALFFIVLAASPDTIPTALLRTFSKRMVNVLYPQSFADLCWTI